MRPDCARAVEGSGQVDSQVALPQLGRLVDELPEMIERSRVVDEDVDRAELPDRLADGRLNLLLVGHVALEGERPAPELPDLLRRRLGRHEPPGRGRLRERAVYLRSRLVRLDQDVGDDDVRAGAGQRQRVGPAEPARASRDKGDAAAEVDLNRRGAPPQM